jgi:hypothetical protein
MMGHAFRAAVVGAVVLVSAATAALAQQNTKAQPPVPAPILTQINQAAATQSPEAYAQTVADIVAANPNLAAVIASTATQVRPAAAVAIAQTLASVVPTSQAQSVVAAIVNALPPADRGTVGSMVVASYINAAPPTVQDSLSVALAPVLAQAMQPAAGPPNQQNAQNPQNDTKPVALPLPVIPAPINPSPV